MVCSLCLGGDEPVVPVRVVQRGTGGGTAYVPLCPRCRRREPLRKLALVGLALTAVAAAGAVGFWALGIGRVWLRVVVEVALGICALRAVASALSRLTTRDLCLRLRRTREEERLKLLKRAPTFRDAASRWRSIRGKGEIAVPVAALLGGLWAAYVRYGHLLSNGRNPDDFIMVRMVGGNGAMTRHATALDVDPLPWVALGVLIVLTVAGFYVVLSLVQAFFTPMAARHAERVRKLEARVGAVRDLVRHAYADEAMTDANESMTSWVFGRQTVPRGNQATPPSG